MTFFLDEPVIEVTRSAGFFSPNVDRGFVRQRHGFVYLFIDGRTPLKMRTPTAHKTGFAMVVQAAKALPNEFVVLKVNGEELNFPSPAAKQVGGSMLRKADDADDFQIQRLN